MTTETLDKLYLEWSQFTKARIARELEAAAFLEGMATRLEGWPHGYTDNSLGKAAADCRAEARKLRGEK